ncbi:MAG TPA: acyl-CoA synthetase FdrA [Candidatus Cloacimonadota bacterium]|nr:acyl-CoA synthetase FdrA [Candidatus Cloacimonadota bacterium]HQL14610.1 acyl-CoA synthetase FdrA [Candidatus Cloacimonadota bacterium]
MPINGTVVQGKYFDSVQLMLLSKEMKKREGVIDAVAIMASKENKAILKATDLLLPEFEQAPENAICIAVKADSEALCQELIETVKVWLDKGLPGTKEHPEMEYQPRSLESAVKQFPEANLALISIAGKYAGAEAMKALRQGLHVLLFSDNVSLTTERQLKEFAVSKNLLLMGPDCGTAIINGIPLAFANAVRRGKIGIVSASGTGLQEVSSVIHNCGEGISQAFGTGGRDGKKEIGGLMLLFCLEYLMRDPNTEVLVLLSKVPDTEVVEKIWQLLESVQKPVVINFLQPFSPPKNPYLYMADTLAETAYKACRLLNDKILPAKEGKELKLETLFTNRTLVTLPVKPTRRYLRGLFSGGTLCYEAQSIYRQKLGSYPFSNTPLKPEYRLQDVWQSKEDTIIDLGADEFTVGRPHPMIDFSLRLTKLEEESRDESVAVILLDVVLGYGSHPQPQAELVPVLQKIKKETDIVIICSVIGTDEDPQNRQAVIHALQNSGAIVTTTNAEACALAVRLIQQLRSK